MGMSSECEEGEIDATLSDFEEDVAEESYFISQSPENDSSDDDFKLHAILPMANLDESFDPQTTPLTGEEYLRLVSFQNAQLPFATRALDAPNPEELLAIPDPINCRLERFSKESIDKAVEAYYSCNNIALPSVETMMLSPYPELGDSEGWFKLLEDKKFNPDVLLVTADQIEERQRFQLVRYYTEWLSSGRIGLGEWEFRSLLRVLQVLDPRMTGRQIHTMRSLSSRCIKLIEDLKAGNELEGVAVKTDLVTHLECIAIVAAKISGQADLLLIE